MIDLVEQLRKEARKSQTIKDHGLLSLAADEIERLRGEIEPLQKALEVHAGYAAEVERLRAALEWIAEDDGGRAGDEARAALGKAKE